MNTAVKFSFAIGGAAALALEMTWMRSASLVFGQTAATIAAVLACYFAGLGVGALAGADSRRHPVQRYALLLWGAAVGALWSEAVFWSLHRDVLQAWLASARAIGTIAGVALAVLPATACFGAMLPVLGQRLANRADVGRRGASLYTLDTLGGAVGCALTGFGLPLLIGVAATYALIAAACLVAGGLALSASLRLGAAPPSGAATDDPRRGTHLDRRRLRLVAAAGGATGLALEVIWVHLFAQVLHNSVYSFTAVALVFLLALAAGAALAGRLLRRIEPAALASVALMSAGVLTATGVWSFMRWTDGLGYIGMRTGLVEYIARIVAMAALTAGPAAVASGAVLPALWTLRGADDEPARTLAELFAANTLGSVVGALAVGFLAAPLLGLRATLFLASAGYVLLAECVRPRAVRWQITGAALLLVVLANPLRAPLVHLAPMHEKLRAVDESASGIVSVVESDGDLQLRLDNAYVLGGSAAAADERRLGLLPLLLHPAPQRVAFVGLATGITASAAVAAAVPNTTIIEVAPAVASAARAFFAPWNAHVLEQPGVRLIVDDGRHYLAAHGGRFDVIVTDLFVPWHQGSGALYSREMYETAARRLAPGGLFCQWLPLYQLTREELEMVAHTFLAVFPDATLWRADFYPDRPVVALVGRLAPAVLDPADLRARMARLPEWSHDALLDTPRGLAMLYAGDLRAAADAFAAAPLNTDDRPRLEFTAPRLTRINAAGDKDWFTGDALAGFYDRLAARPQPGRPFPPSPDLLDAQRAGTALLRYAVAASQHDTAGAARFEADVRRLVPDVIADAESHGDGVRLADARRTLLDLRQQQEDVRRRLDAAERRLRALGPAEATAR